MSDKPKRRWYRFSLRKLLLFVAVAPLFLAGCWQLCRLMRREAWEPSVLISATVEGEDVVFQLQQRNTLGLLAFQVDELGGDVLWKMDLPYSRENALVYGKLPAKVGPIAAYQTISGKGIAPPPIRGKSVVVTVTYRRNERFPSAASHRQRLRIPPP